jgi:preprotein translocase subunit SecA
MSFIGARAISTGCKVDVVTSNEVLAERDASKYREYYADLGLIVGDNIKFYEEFMKSQGQRLNVYRDCQVLYGVTSSFCGDILRDILYGKEVTAREKSFLIADEVDSMLVDNQDFITKISGVAKGLSSLQEIRKRVWRILVMASVCPRGGQPVSDEQLAAAIHEEVSQALDNNSIKIKPFYKNLGLRMLGTWINSAIQALRHTNLRVDYIIENRKIVIIDKDTGVKMDRTRWQNGLHEFLELKHGLPVGQDSFTSLYYSNLRFYTDYGTGLCGLTGTLGSIHTCTFLSDTYGTDIFRVPTFRPSRRVTLPFEIVATEAMVLAGVAETVVTTCFESRPTLVIMPTIQKVREAEMAINSACYKLGGAVPMRCIVYIDSEKDNDKLSNIDGSTVIIATNLAGRGTDIEIADDIDERGGLRVILGYFPSSLRVQDQGFGRTGRKGQNGDCTMIAKVDWIRCEDGPVPLPVLNRLRDAMEVRTLESSRMRIKQKKAFDDMFRRITEELICSKTLNMRKNPAIFESLKEQWGIFFSEQELKLHDHPDRSPEDMMQEFNRFFEELRQGLENGRLSENATHHMLKVDQLLKENKQAEAAEVLEASRGEEEPNVNYHMRKAMIENNNGNLDRAKEEVKAMLLAAEKDVVNFRMNAAVERNTAIVTGAIVQVAEDQQRIQNFGADTLGFDFTEPAVHARNVAIVAPNIDVAHNDQQAVDFGFGHNLNNDRERMVQIQGPALQEELDANIAAIHRDHDAQIREEVEGYLNHVHHIAEILLNTIETNIANNNQPDTRITLQSGTNTTTNKIGEDPPVPEPIKPPEKKKKRGFLGFIIGAIEIIAGAVLTICSGGMLAAFGMNLIMSGIDLINLNIQMNRDGTYDGDAIVRKAIQDGIKSIALSPPTAALGRFFPVINKVAEMFNSTQATEEAARNIVQAQADVRHIYPPPTPEDRRRAQEEAVQAASEANSKFCAEDFDGYSEEQKRAFLNQQLNDWYDAELKDQLEAINPQKLQAFEDQVGAISAVQRDNLAERVVGGGLSKVLLYLVTCRQISAESVENYFMIIERLARPNRVIALHKIAARCKEVHFDGIEDEDFIEGRVMAKVTDALQKFESNCNKDFYSWLLNNLLSLSRNNVAEKLEQRGKQLNEDIDAFNARHQGVRADLERRQQELNSEAAGFNAGCDLMNSLKPKLKDDGHLKQFMDLIFEERIVVRSPQNSSRNERNTTGSLDSNRIKTIITSSGLAVSAAESDLLSNTLSHEGFINHFFDQCEAEFRATIEGLAEALDDVIVQEIYAFLVARIEQDS